MSINKEEIDIALKLPKSINENDLISRDVSSVDRIIEIYFVDFLFDYLDKHTLDGSILFGHLNKSNLQDKAIKWLHDNYIGKFDFNLVNSSLFECSYQRFQTNNKLKILTLALSFILFIFIFRYEYTKNYNDKKYEINQIQQAEKNDEFMKLIEKMKEKISTLENIIQSQNSRMVGEFFYSILPPSIVEPKGAIHVGGAKKVSIIILNL